MKSTSTQIPLWQDDCEKFSKLGEDFEVKDVQSEEQERFCRLFAVKHPYKCKFEDDKTTMKFIRDKF